MKKAALCSRSHGEGAYLLIFMSMFNFVKGVWDPWATFVLDKHLFHVLLGSKPFLIYLAFTVDSSKFVFLF